MKRVLIFSVVVFAVIGCADTHKLVRMPGANPESHLDAADSIYIAVPEDGAYGSQVYRGSGETTAQIIQSAFARHAGRVRSGREAQSFDQAMEHAKATDSDFLVFPTILHWEERATEWSGIPDRVEVKVEVVDVGSQSTVASAIAQGKSGLATFGGDRPQDLLPKPVGKFVDSLY